MSYRARNGEWKTEYNITDHLGSVKLSVNTDGSVVNSKTYSDFGKASTSATSDRLGYIGKENDIESGLGDFGVRKYNGGRFLSSFINLLTLNSYAV